ncbi:MAG: DUF4430 domain-containing protein [Solobacterium sp.]|nr:DUF4430 domain-containing protein [Solobacterium sp.]
MKDNNKKTMWIAIVAVVAALLLGVWYFTKPKGMQGSKAVVIEVKDKDGNVKKFEGRTDAEFLKGAMDDFSAVGFTYKSDVGQYGMFITEVDGKTASDADKAYWAIYVNGEYGMYMADQQPVADKDVFTFAYENY